MYSFGKYDHSAFIYDKSDTANHPLSDFLWNELKKLHPDKTQDKIFSEYKIKSHYKGIVKTLYNTPGKGKLPVEAIYREGKEATALEIFMDEIYNIELYNEKSVELKDAINAVKLLPSDGEIGILKQYLSKDILYLKDKYQELGKFVIIPQNDKVDKPAKFSDFEEFSDKIKNLTRPLFKDGKVPAIHCCLTRYNYLINKIEWFASTISRYFAQEPSFVGKIGFLIWEAYYISQQFERSHNELFYPMIKQEALRKEGKKDQSVKNVKHAKLWAFYQEQIIRNKDLEDSQIAQKFFSKNPNVYKNIPTITSLLSRLKKRAF